MVSDKKCEAITVCVVPCTIDPALVLEVESMIEEYDKASPPMDRPRFAVQLIEKARGY
jgi:predicted metal-dependent hydrolase